MFPVAAGGAWWGGPRVEWSGGRGVVASTDGVAHAAVFICKEETAPAVLIICPCLHIGPNSLNLHIEVLILS
jgi:hypothetical protein